MSAVESRLAELGLTLPPVKTPVANYLPCKRVGDTLYVSAKVSDQRGTLGVDLTLAQGQAAAKNCAMILLAVLKHELGDLDRIVSIDKMIGFVHSGPGFTQQPQVVNGASDLLVALWGEPGRHARTATGVAQLPFGAAVQLEMILSLRPGTLPGTRPGE